MKQTTNKKQNKTKSKHKANPPAGNKIKEELKCKQNKKKTTPIVQTSTSLQRPLSMQALLENLNPSKIQQAVVLSEILNKPVCKRRRKIGSR